MEPGVLPGGNNPDHLIQEVMGRCRVQCSALHDLNLPVDAATENAISDFFFGNFLLVLMIIAREEFRKCFSFYLKLKRIKIQFKNSKRVPLETWTMFLLNGFN